MASSRGGRKRGGTGGGGTTHAALGIPLAVVSGCLVFLSFPPFNIFPFQWVSLAPLAVAVRGRGGLHAFWIGLVAGFATNLGGFHWISDLLREFGHLGPVPSYALTSLLAAYQGLTFAVASGTSAAVARRLQWNWTVVFPFVFTAVEYLVPFIFPWYFANGQQRFFAVTQVVELTGVAGLTFLIALASCAVGEVAICRIEGRGFPVKTVVVAGLLVAADIAYGVVRIREIDRQVEEAPKLRVGMVEADVGIWEKEAKQPDGSPLPIADQVRMLYGNLLKHQYLSAAVEKEGRPGLLVWPESSYIPLREVYARRTDRVAVSVTADGRVFATEAGGAIQAFGDSAMRVTGLRGIAAAHEERMIAVGPRGAAYAFDGKGWRREPTGVDRDLFAVALSPDGSEALAVGAQGAAAALRGGEWRPVETGTTADLRAVAYLDGRGFVAAGDGGVIVAIAGRSATLLPSGATQDLHFLVPAEDGGLVAADRDGKAAVRVPARGLLRPGDGARVASSRTAGSRRTVTRGEGAAAREMTGPTDLVDIAYVPFKEGYPLPNDVRWLYTARSPLPPGGMDDIAAAVAADSRTPERDRNAALRGLSTPLLFGAITSREGENGEPVFYNTALLVDRDGRVLGRYDKNYLLVFGEYLPFSDLFPFLKKWVPEAGDFVPGDRVEVFRFGDVRLGVMICYEDIIPSFTRRLAGLDPNVLVNITNDAWFGKTAEPWLHLQLATFRSIENRLFLVRSTNTGVSAIVDPVGRIVEATSIEDPETVIADVAILSGDTVYRRFGDVFAWGCCGVALILVLVAWRKKG